MGDPLTPLFVRSHLTTTTLLQGKHHEVWHIHMNTIQAYANLHPSAEQKAKANAEMAKSSGQATNTAAPPAEKQHGQPGGY